MAAETYRLFLSYAAEDREFVESQLIPSLRGLHLEVFYDRELPHGEPLHSIFDELAKSTLFALKWNPGGSGGEVVEFTGTSTGRFNLGGSLQRRCTVH